MKRIAISAVTMALALTASGVVLAKAGDGSYAGHELAGQAHITMAQARDIALKARPGKITDQELEKEGGGSGLRYSFDVTGSGGKYEVGVDAMTGKVLENAREGAHPD
jgi:uncharacterized membrane protein YkoI